MDESTKKNDLTLLIGLIAVFLCFEDDISFDDTSDVATDPSIVEQLNDIELQNTLSVKSFVKDKAIEMYAKKGLENLKKSLKSTEPLIVGSIDKEKIKDNEMDIVFQLMNVKLYNLGSFQMKKFKSISAQNAIEFSVEIPTVRATSNYIVNGTFRGKKVNGKGDADINITGVSVNNGRIVIVESPEEIQINSINFCYNFNDLSLKQTGLQIEGLKPEEVTNFLNDSGKRYLKENRQNICDRVTSELKKTANAKLKGKSRDQLAEMMKEM